MGLHPHGGPQHDLDLLAAREGAHARVRRELCLEADVVQVALGREGERV